MKSLPYYILTAFKNVWQEKWINLLTVLSISIGILIRCTFSVISLNLDSILKHWSKGFGIVVYMQESISKEGEESLQKALMKDSDFEKVTYVSKDEALKGVREALGEDAIIIDEIEENPLPSSFELKLRNELLEPEIVRNKALKIKKMQGVAEVQYGEQWLSSLNKISETMQLGALILGGVIFIAVTFITYSTIKIFFYRRKDEVETLKLLGATKMFIKSPYLLEGLFIGALGGIISSILIYTAYTFMTMRVSEFLPSFHFSIAVVPIYVYFFIPAASACMSIVGSFVAIGRIKY